MDSLLHDARNPLNALAINLEVLAERLRREAGGTLPANHEKNIKTMREQVVRVDGVMKQFADFIAPRAGSAEVVDFSALLQRALEVIGHQGRKVRVGIEPQVEAGLKVRAFDERGIRFLALQPLARALARSESGGQVRVSLAQEGDAVCLRVTDTNGSDQEPSIEARHALEVFSLQHQGRLSTLGSVLELRLPFA